MKLKISGSIYEVQEEKRNGELAFTKHSVKIFKGHCRM